MTCFGVACIICIVFYIIWCQILCPISLLNRMWIWCMCNEWMTALSKETFSLCRLRSRPNRGMVRTTPLKKSASVCSTTWCLGRSQGTRTAYSSMSSPVRQPAAGEAGRTASGREHRPSSITLTHSHRRSAAVVQIDICVWLSYRTY